MLEEQSRPDMEATDRVGVAAMVQKQMEQMEHSSDERDRASMVLVRTTPALCCAGTRAATRAQATEHATTRASPPRRWTALSGTRAPPSSRRRCATTTPFARWTCAGAISAPTAQVRSLPARRARAMHLSHRSPPPPTLRGLLSLTPFLAALLALPVALAELVENNVHLQSLGLEWNSIGMSESGLQRLCQVKACQVARLCFRRVRAPLLLTSRSGGGGKERGARGDRPGLF